MKGKLSNKVHELRTKKGLTQKELAEKVGVTRQTIIAIEKGDYSPSVVLAIKLAQSFKVKVENLFRLG